jgi:tetratricopeptide (TPR) repeat protein
LAIEPKNVAVLNNKGGVLYHLGNYTQSVNYFDKALDIDPKYVNALNNKGVALYSLGKYTEAIQNYDKALDIDPKYVNALNNKGNALAKLIEESANVKPTEYHDQQPTNQPYQYVYLSSYRDIVVVAAPPPNYSPLNYGIYTEAVQIYDAALSVDPKNTYVLGNKGLVFIKLSYYTEAIQIFDKILSIDSNNVAGLYNKGTCLDKLGQHIQAKELHNKALKINPNYTADYQNRIALVSKLSKSQEDITLAPAL